MAFATQLCKEGKARNQTQAFLQQFLDKLWRLKKIGATAESSAHGLVFAFASLHVAMTVCIPNDELVAVMRRRDDLTAIRRDRDTSY